MVFVPANRTGELRPMDLSVNKSVKNFMCSRFEEWYAKEVFARYQGSSSGIKPVKFPMAVMKPLSARWLKEMYDHLLAHPDIITNGFNAAGITEWLS